MSRASDLAKANAQQVRYSFVVAPAVTDRQRPVVSDTSRANYHETQEVGVWPNDSRQAFTECRTVGGPWRAVDGTITVAPRSLLALR
jgi:hypothetical protein